MPLLYDMATAAYHLGIQLAAPFHPKARRWIKGRRGLFQRLEERADALHGCFWMHAASTGEFEQGLPVLEALKARHPEMPVLLTFFSPSGYEACRDHPLATHVDYLPGDSATNARRIVELLRPRAALWVKYEFWYHHLRTLHRSDIPVYLLSAAFRPGQAFFRWYGGTHRRMLRCFRHIFVQDERSRDLLASIGTMNVTVSGDTRFDRVAAIANESREVSIAKAFRGEGPLLVCGSTWPQDEAVLREAIAGLSQAPKYLVVPHETDEKHLEAIEATFPRPLVRWSELEGSTEENIAAMLGTENAGTLLMDRIGLLSRTYQHADVAFVGGGFKDGIHSILEAAAWGVPVIFGPLHQKFAEARGLIEAGGGFSVGDADELRHLLQRLLSDAQARQQAAEAAGRYVRENSGATERVLQELILSDHAGLIP